MAMKTIKQYLVRRGPDSTLVQGALKAHGLLHGFEVNFSGDRILLRKLDREMILSKSYYVQVPLMMESYELFFDTIAASDSNGLEILDFSVPRLHRYKMKRCCISLPFGSGRRRHG
jgi:hypothetical protein